MIRTHNRKQLLRAFGHLVVCLVATAFTFGFAYVALSYAAERGRIDLAAEDKRLISLAFVVLTYLGGLFHHWRHQRSLVSDYTELFQSESFASERGLIDNHVNSYAANLAHALLSIFYSAPTRLLRALHSLRIRIRFSPTLESELERLHSQLQSVGKWHDARRYRNESHLLRQLVIMEQVDFSPHKGRIKAA